MKVTARILYDKIREMNPEGGLYVWVDPNESSTLAIQSLIKDAPFKTENSTEYHATVLYHIGKLPEDAVMPADYPCSATINEIVSWPGKNGTVAFATTCAISSAVNRVRCGGWPTESSALRRGWLFLMGRPTSLTKTR